MGPGLGVANPSVPRWVAQAQEAVPKVIALESNRLQELMTYVKWGN